MTIGIITDNPRLPYYQSPMAVLAQAKWERQDQELVSCEGFSEEALRFVDDGISPLQQKTMGFTRDYQHPDGGVRIRLRNAVSAERIVRSEVYGGLDIVNRTSHKGLQHDIAEEHQRADETTVETLLMTLAQMPWKLKDDRLVLDDPIADDDSLQFFWLAFEKTRNAMDLKVYRDYDKHTTTFTLDAQKAEAVFSQHDLTANIKGEGLASRIAGRLADRLLGGRG